ncbi:hypothetical protein [Priestia sp. TGN 0903]|uniref:hypothetical protein n=1 Tax=Priestia sp. TGN 0903 TaxID=3420730 RepID=UPI003D7764F0
MKDILYNEFITLHSKNPDSITDPIVLSTMWEPVINSQIPTILAGKTNNTSQIGRILRNFEENFIAEIPKLKSRALLGSSNLFTKYKAPIGGAANQITRSLSTKIGNLWESIAVLSSNVISPEKELGLKLKGIDVILVDKTTKIPYYSQLKTKKDTLTGSQSHRSDEELAAFSNAYFVACIDCHCKWTYSGTIPKLVGAQFWDKTDIIYTLLEIEIGKVIRSIDTHI